MNNKHFSVQNMRHPGMTWQNISLCSWFMRQQLTVLQHKINYLTSSTTKTVHPVKRLELPTTTLVANSYLVIANRTDLKKMG